MAACPGDGMTAMGMITMSQAGVVAPPGVRPTDMSCMQGMSVQGTGGPEACMPDMGGLVMQGTVGMSQVIMPGMTTPGMAMPGMFMAMASAPRMDLQGKGVFVKGRACTGMSDMTMRSAGLPVPPGMHGGDVGKGNVHWQGGGKSSGGDGLYKFSGVAESPAKDVLTKGTNVSETGFANLGVVLPPKNELMAMAAGGMSKTDILNTLGPLPFGASGKGKGPSNVATFGSGKPATSLDSTRRRGVANGSGAKKPNPPEKLFVGGLPLSVTEQGLKTFLARYGKVKSIQLKYDITGNFKGFAFITFESREVAEELCNTKGLVYEGAPIDFRRPLAWSGPGDSSPREARVFVGGLPRTATKEAVESYFSNFGQVASIKMKYDGEGNLKGFAFVTFEDKMTAEIACSAKCHKFEGKAIDVRLADSDQPTDLHDKVFVGGLPKDATEEEVVDHFSVFGAVASIDMKYDEKTGRFRGFCFVTFESPSSAEAVYRRDNTFKTRVITCRPSVRKPAIDSAVIAAMAAQTSPAVGVSADHVAMLQQYSALGGSMVPAVGSLAPWADEKAIQRAQSVALRQGLSGLLGSASLAAQGAQYGPMATHSGAPDRPNPF